MSANRDETLSVLFWLNLAGFCLHVLDETLMAGGFVAGVRTHFWPTYTAARFFWFNTTLLAVIALSNALYDFAGNRIVVVPLLWVWERALNGLWHLS